MFRQQHSLDRRTVLSQAVRLAHPDRCPVILEPGRGVGPFPSRRKFLVPLEVKMGELLHEIRGYLPEGVHFFQINGYMVPLSETVLTVYHKHRDADGFLYLQYWEESAFG